MTLTLRSTKGSALTYAELDNNFLHLQGAIGTVLPTPWEFTGNTTVLSFANANTTLTSVGSTGNITVHTAYGQAFVNQDTTTAPFYANTEPLSGSSYATLAKIRVNGAANTRFLSIGGLHNADNTVDFVIHGIDNGDGNNVAWRFKTTGDFVSPGNVTAYSDVRLKENVETITSALDKVSNMRGVTFDMNGKRSTGVIAQEVQQVLPEVVIEGEYLSVAYGNLVGVLIEAIKELKKEVDDLKRGK